MRTIIDLPAKHIEALNRIAKRQRLSRAELIRRAVARWLRFERQVVPDQAFGLWRGREEDALEYEDRIRAEWTQR